MIDNDNPYPPITFAGSSLLDKMLEIARGKHEFSIRESSKADALDYYKKQGNEYKVELIENLEDGTNSQKHCKHTLMKI